MGSDNMVQDYSYQQSPQGQSYPSINPASTLRRIGAYIIDILLISLVMGLIFGLFFMAGFFSFQMTPQTSSPTDFTAIYGGFQIVLTLLSALIQFSYFVVMESEKFGGATLGKKVLDIKVVGEYGREVGYGPSLIRNLARLLWSIPCIGFIILIIDIVLIADDDQRIGDRIADTYVVRESPSSQAYSQSQQSYSNSRGKMGQQQGRSSQTPPPPKPSQESKSKGFSQKAEPSQDSQLSPSDPWKEEPERSSSPPGEQKKQCPQCGKKTLVVSSSGSKYCTNCDYTQWD